MVEEPTTYNQVRCYYVERAEQMGLKFISLRTIMSLGFYATFLGDFGEKYYSIYIFPDCRGNRVYPILYKILKAELLCRGEDDNITIATHPDCNISGYLGYQSIDFIELGGEF